jgi:hypothetical protein
VQAALDLTRDFRSQLFDTLVAANCSIGSTLLVGDVVTGVASGTGALVLALGGAEATSGDIVEEDLFGDAGAPVDVGAPVVGSPGVPLPATPIVTPGRAVGGSVERGPDARRCESTHPRGGSGCSVGAATVAGAVGAAATAGVALLDLRRRRHHAREVLS